MPGASAPAAPAPAATSNIAGPGTGSVIPTPGGSGQALIVTSGASRAATSTNVAKLQAATSNLIPQQTDAQRQATLDASGLNADQQDTPPATGTTPGGTTININGSNPAPGGTTGTGTGGSGGAPTAPTGGLTSDQMKAAGITDSTGWTYDNASGLFTPPAAGSTAPGTTTTTPADANSQAVASINDPAIAAQYKASLDALDQGISQAQANLQAAQATVANDPAAAAAVQAIQDKYDQQIQLMEAKNDQVIGKANTAVGAFGGLGVMSQTFLNDEQSQADQRISDLVAQEQDLILKAQIAYQSNDVKALNTAMTAYDTANKSKLTAINDLLTATNKQVAQQQAQQKIDAAAAKNQIAADVSKSKNLGAAIAQNIADAGLTDPGQISDYIASVAQEYGITDPSILQNAINVAQAAATKASNAAANTADTIANRDARTNIAATAAANKGPAASKPGTDNTYTYTAADVTAGKGILKSGGKGYAAAGSDGYSDPGAYTSLMNSWVKLGGTVAGFAKVYPPKTYVNPASYSQLPAAIRPKVTTPATTVAPP